MNDIPSGTDIFADPLIQNVFNNLVSNAVIHGTKVTTIRFYLNERNGSTAIVCEDDGIGIPLEKKEKLF